MRRRTFLQLSGLGAAHAYLLGGAGFGCGDGAGGPALPSGPDQFLGGYVSNAGGEHDSAAFIEGRVPAGLRGTLYRNGPGLFQRGDMRKTCVVDGDGMIRAWTLASDGAGAAAVDFKSRFVRTEKYVEEDAAGAFIYDTWSTKTQPKAPGVPDIRNQAGVSVRAWSDRLFAFDEGVLPYELDPVTLDTIGLADATFSPGAPIYAAHPKKLPSTGEWVHVGLDFAGGRIFLTVFDAAFNVVEAITHTASPVRYVHDFFATPTHLVVALQPTVFDLQSLLSGETIRESMRWQPDLGAEWLVFERGSDAAPRIFSGPPAWMWHTANAQLRGSELVCDWVGYDDPGHFLAEDAALCAVMQGATTTRHTAGTLRRTTLDLTTGTLHEETVHDQGGLEFPLVDPGRQGQSATACFLAQATDASRIFPNAVARVDLATGAAERYDFGLDTIVGEPILARPPGASVDSDGAGWLLVEITAIGRNVGGLAILDAEHLADGPVAIAWLPHHLPISFHGDWSPA